MRYCLGIDIGNSVVTAAVADSSGVETVGLGRQSPSMPALVHVTPDGTILTGDDAVRATDLEPTWSARMLARRLDDPAPIQLGERTGEVTDLLSAVLWDVLDRVATLRGAPPEHVVLTRPGALGPRGRDSLAAAVAKAGRPDATTTTAPLACGAWFAATGPPGARFAVYDFGGGAFEAAVLRTDAQDVELVCPPDGAPRLGGAELDDLVHDYLDTRLYGALTRWDPRSRAGARARHRVLAACTTAKETLSTERVTEVTLRLPSDTRRQPLHREELEALIRHPVAETVTVLRRVLAAAGERPGVLVLTGGSARIPLVMTLIREAVGPGLRIEHAPDGVAAWGAAQLASRRARASAPGPPPVRPPAVPSGSRPSQDPPRAGDARGRPTPASSPSRRPAPPAASAPSGGGPPVRPARRPAPGPRPSPIGGPPARAPEQVTEFVHAPVAPHPGSPWAPAVQPPGPVAPEAASPPGGRGASPDSSDPRWHNPSIGRPVAVAVALLAVVAAIAAIIFAVLHRIGGVVAGLVEPQILVEAWSTYINPLW